MMDRAPRLAAQKRPRERFSTVAPGVQKVRHSEAWRVKLPTENFGKRTYAIFSTLAAAQAFKSALPSLLSVEYAAGTASVESTAPTVPDDADFADFVQALCTGDVDVPLPAERVPTPVEPAEPVEPATPPTPASVGTSRVRPKPLAKDDPLLCRERLLCKACATWPSERTAPTKRRLFCLKNQLLAPVKAAPLRGPIRSMWGESLKLF